MLSDWAPTLRNSPGDTPVYILEGKEPGGTVFVAGGTHGNEIAVQWIDSMQGRVSYPLVAFSTEREGDRKMNPATRKQEDNAVEPMLYMALELSNQAWKLTFGDGAKRRQGSVPAGDLRKLREALLQAKERFGLPGATRVISCYEAGRDGSWLHRSLVSMGIENDVVDSSSIEVHRRKRRAMADRIDGEHLLTKLMRYHAGEREGWSVVRVPTLAEAAKLPRAGTIRVTSHRRNIGKSIV